jgi:hypothetical protein
VPFQEKKHTVCPADGVLIKKYILNGRLPLMAAADNFFN